MLLHQIRTAFAARIDNTVYWTTARQNALANDAMRSIASHFGTRMKGYQILYTVDGQQHYALPVDFIANDLLYTNTDELMRKIKFVDSPDEIYSKYYDPGTYEGSPELAFIWPIDERDNLWLYPIPDKQYTLEWFYYREAPELVNNNDEPMIAKEFHTFIVDYMEMRTKVFDGEMSEMEYTALWEKTLTKMSMFKTAKMALTVENTPGNARRNFPVRAGDLIDPADSSGGIWGIS